jgi:uncharacterized Zn-finger protein
MGFGIKINGSFVSLVNDNDEVHSRVSFTGSADSNQKKKFSCPTCKKVFSCVGHLQRHVRMHTGEKPFQCPFDNCNSRFSRHDNMMQHYRAHLIRTGKDPLVRKDVGP